MRVLICGATGSIGQQTLKTLKLLKYQLVGISFYQDYKQAQKISAPYFFSPIDIEHSNVNSYDELIKKTKPDLIVNAIVGIAGLEVTLLAIKHKVDIALANKESLLVAGQFVMKLAKTNKVTIYPIDSEHSGVYAILQQMKARTYKHIYITASGGPFYNYNKRQLAKVTYQQAIKHPK
jgi:1-deoxy-D-xylulose-5-phosphate reductoisomerase